jgi:hypothetical protein
MLGTASIKVRPLKLALLVDPNSASQVREAIRLACGLWGGMFFPIIPMHRRLPATWRQMPVRSPSTVDVLKGYLDGFDPDILVQFCTTVPDWVRELRLRVLKPAEVVGARFEASREPAFGIGVSELLDAIYKEHFKYTAKYPMRVVVPAIPSKFGLFWASVFGEYDASTSAGFTQELLEALEIERPKVAASDYLDLTGPNVLSPRRITAWDLTRRVGPRGGSHAYVFYMDATSVEDVIDFWNLRATGKVTVPLPKQFAQDAGFKQAIEAFLIEERIAWPHDPDHFDTANIVRSRRSTMEEMTAFAKTLHLPARKAGETPANYYGLQHWYPRIWDEWARSHDGGVADVHCEEEMEIDISRAADLEMQLKPLLPSFVSRSWFYSDALCANDFDLRLYGADEHRAEVYPKAKGNHLINAISGIGLGGDWRIGRRGLVHLVTRSSSEPRTAPASETILFAWLADHGWKAELSPPGVLAKQIYKRLNGFPGYIAHRSVLGLFEYMNGGAVGKNGAPLKDRGLSLEREISVGELKKRLKDAGKGGLYSDFLAKGIFRLGLRTKCPTCQRNSWFPLQSLRESIECPKCLGAFAAAGNIESSSSWFFRTAGPFSVPNYADGAFAVLLTLDYLGGRGSRALRTTSVPSFTATAPGKEPLEADLAMFWRETTGGDERDGILFGECKTYGPFEAKDIERMLRLAREFPGAVLVFSTLRDSLSKQEVTALTRLAKTGRKHWKADRPINPLLILTGAELLSHRPAPYCWTEAQQKRFQHLSGLLDLCDATQQLHLGLPPLREEWNKGWERKRERRRLREAAKARVA